MRLSFTAKGYVIAFLSILVWSVTGILIGYVISNHHMPALLLALWRNLLVCVALIPALFVIHRPLLRITRARFGFYASYGFILAVFNSIWALSVKENGAAVATVLAYGSAGFTAVLAWWLFRERLGVFKILAVMASLTGCVLVSNAHDLNMWKLNPLGVCTGLLSGLFFAAYTLMGKEAARRNINQWTSLLYSFAFGSFFIMIFNLFPALPGAAGSFGALFPELPVNGWLLMMLLSFGPTLLGFGFYNLSMNYLPASIVNLLATLEPALTAVEAYFLLGERMSMIQIVGGVIIMGAVVLAQFEKEIPSPDPARDSAGSRAGEPRAMGSAGVPVMAEPDPASLP